MKDFYTSPFITDKSPSRKYESGKKGGTRKHIGQLKLAIGLLGFINHAIQKTPGTSGHKTKILLAYVGSAPGQYLGIILSMFPNLQLKCWDPRLMEVKFVSKDDTSRYVFYKQLFRDEDAHELAVTMSKHEKNGYLTLFVSDIRRDIQSENAKERVRGELMIQEDMMMQKAWSIIVNAQWTQLKFRPPYSFVQGDKSYSMTKIEYFGGPGVLVYKQVFPSALSTETRIVVPRSALGKSKVYDTVKYEDQMFAHNLAREHNAGKETISLFKNLRSTTRFTNLMETRPTSFDAYVTMRTIADYVRKIRGLTWNSKDAEEMERELLDDILEVTVPNRIFSKLAPSDLPHGK